MKVEWLRMLSCVALCTGFVLAVGVQAGCDRNPFAQSPAAKMRSELSDTFGPSLGKAISEAWRPVLDANADMEVASANEDFEAYHAALMKLRAVMPPAVDETIKVLDADPTWRRVLLAESMAKYKGGSTDANPDAEVGRAEGLSRLFPSFEGPSDEWIRRGAVENPRLAGEMARALLDLQGQGMRLYIYFGSALSAEAVKAAGEAIDGFRNPSEGSAPQ